MAAFAILTESHSCKISLVRINRNDFDAGFVKEEVEFAGHGFGCTMLQDDPGFDDGSRGDQFFFGNQDEFHEPLALGFSQENGSEGGSVDNHRGDLTRYAVLVVSENLVLGQVVFARQRVHAAEYLKKLLFAGRCGPFAGQTLESLLEGGANRFSQAFPGLLGDFAGQVVCAFVFDIESHTPYILSSSFFQNNRSTRSYG